MWLILVAASGKDKRHGAYPELSDAIGVDDWRLTDDVHRMEAAGLVVRQTDPQDPREPRVELTEAGKGFFHRLLRVVVAYDARLRTELTAEEIDSLSSTLQRLRSTVADAETSKGARSASERDRLDGAGSSRTVFGGRDRAQVDPSRSRQTL
jgi:DNA-binding MarR family transcriptional regulator